MGEAPKKRVVRLDPDRSSGDFREEAREAIVRRFAWQKPAIAVFFFGLSGLAYWAIEEKREEALRQQVLAAQARAAQLYGGPFEKLRKKVAELLPPERGRYRGDFHDPIFHLSSLRDARGTYIRLPIDRARSRRLIEKAARAQHRDSVSGCLGVETRLYGQVLIDGTIVAPEYRRKIQRATSQTRLRALDEDMVVRIRRDIPNLADELPPDYLLAVMDEPGGERPRKRGFVWDLHTGRLLVRARTSAQDDMIMVQWVGAGAILTNRPPGRTVRNTASDCAVATAIRTLTGEPLPGLGGSEPAEERPDDEPNVPEAPSAPASTAPDPSAP